MANDAPHIMATPSGYHMARGIEDHLSKHYLPRRNSPVGNIWVPSTIKRFGDSDAVAHIDQHIRGVDLYIVADMHSRRVLKPEASVDEYEGHHVVMDREDYVLRGKPGDTFAYKEGKQHLDVNFSDLIRTVDAARNAVTNRGRITAVLPFFPSGRQDRRNGRESLDLRSKISQLEEAGVNHILTLDIHTKATELGFRRANFDHLTAAYTLIEHIKTQDSEHIKQGYFVAPDANAVPRNIIYSQEFSTQVGFLFKKRDPIQPNRIEGSLGFGGDRSEIAGKHIYVVDDMIDTGGTLIEAARFLNDNNAASVSAIATHPVFSYPAIQRLDAAVQSGKLRKVIVSNSITLPQDTSEKYSWLQIVDVHKYIAKVIDSLHAGNSISKLLREVE